MDRPSGECRPGSFRPAAQSGEPRCRRRSAAERRELREMTMRREAWFYSDGLKISAMIYQPGAHLACPSAESRVLVEGPFQGTL
jgi:hypothetical protein